ncbi:MAE_28990/MAE_18760 family HEPN-like nuclease [Streptomyces sp. NPDC047718]|uniref:MAE_28990/MAE_18760 family HEPN-like nuclease n=1 Tax=Streptomyces sp. NPDC047718 TaxID=3155479 RepID=UPI0033F71093
MRTLAELQDALDEDLAWRRSELHSYLSATRRAESDSPTQRTLCRAGVPLLYAHWEGYAKHCLSLYLQYVGRRRLTYGELHPAFVALGHESSLDSQEGLSATRRIVRRAQALLSGDSVRATIPWRRGVDTQSNLNSSRCFDLFESLGLDASPLNTKARLIDYRLLKARNEIAHGQYLDVGVESYEELHLEVLVIMNFVRNTVNAAAENGLYKRPVVS